VYHGQFHLSVTITWPTATKGTYYHLTVYTAHIFVLLFMYCQTPIQRSSEANLDVMGLRMILTLVKRRSLLENPRKKLYGHATRIVADSFQLKSSILLHVSALFP
jgi:hypothetical protein